MRKLLLIIAVSILSAGSTYSQWHYTITSQSFNGNCNNIGATLQESIYEQEVPKWAAKTYNSQEECETARQRWGMVNYSSGGCFARVTSSPCQGNTNGGGNGTGTGIGTSIGGGSFKTSMYSSTAIGEPYFAPNEAYAVSSMGEDLEIKLAALNKSFNDAVGGHGIKTGDKPYDEQYKNQVAELSRNRKKEELGDYTLYPRIDKVYLDQENNFSDGTSDIIVPIDPKRIKNQERDQMIEKSQKKMQHRLDSIDKINQHKLDSINKNYNKPNVEMELSKDPRDSDDREASLASVALESYQVGAAFFRNVEDGTRYIKETFDVTIPGSEQLSNLNATLSDLGDGIKEVRDMAIVIINGDLPRFTEKLKEYATDAVAIAVDPYLDKITGSALTFVNKYTNTKDLLTDIGNPLKKAVGKFTNTVLDGALKAESTNNYIPYGKSTYKAASMFNGKVAKMTEKQLNKN